MIDDADEARPGELHEGAADRRPTRGAEISERRVGEMQRQEATRNARSADDAG
jgi:hypothetical protein